MGRDQLASSDDLDANRLAALRGSDVEGGAHFVRIVRKGSAGVFAGRSALSADSSEPGTDSESDGSQGRPHGEGGRFTALSCQQPWPSGLWQTQPACGVRPV